MGCNKKVNMVAKSCPYCYSTSFYQYQESKQIHVEKVNGKNVQLWEESQ